MMKRVPLLLITIGFLVSCSEESDTKNSRFADEQALISCNIIRATRIFDAASTIREVNNARVTIGGKAYLDDETYIEKAVFFDVCENLIADAPGWRESLDDSVASTAAGLLDLDLFEYHAVRNELPDWLVSEMTNSSSGALREFTYSTIVEVNGFEVGSDMYPYVQRAIEYCSGLISIIDLLKMSGDCPGETSTEIERKAKEQRDRKASELADSMELRSPEVQAEDRRIAEEEAVKQEENKRIVEEEAVKQEENRRIAKEETEREAREEAEREFRENYLPMIAIKPRYPTDAASRGIQGWCLVNFTVDGSGNVIGDSISIVDAEPLGVWDESAKLAAARFKFRPRVLGGKGVSVSDVQYLFEYEL